ncbi:MAG: aminotransferase class V-fold PLP-dependent enzyme, partial [Bacillota bacterium]
AFGANMTTLSFSLARALARGLEPGDEIIITDLDHEANRAPWLGLEEMGAKVHSVRFHPEGCTLDFEHLESLVTSRTRVAAIGAASNAVGTQTDLARVRKTLPEGCVLVVDGVHYTPHRPVDVREMDCDFFLCSAYKFFGPHVGVLYGRGEVFAKLATDRVRPQKNEIPDRIETGTLNHEGMAGTAAAVAFMADPESSGVPRTRDNILSSISRMGAYEDALFETLYRGLESIPTVRIYGPPPDHARTPTAAFTLDGLDARTVAENLAKKGIFSWDGHFYAMTLVEKLDPGPGGLVRVGLAPYNTSEEVDRFLNSIEDMI